MILNGSTPITADGTGAAVALPDDVRTVGKVGTLYIIGSLGGGTITIEASPVASGDVWQMIDNGAFTAEAVVSLQITAKRLRVIMAGSTAPSVNVYYE